jgi:hypothetical protein
MSKFFSQKISLGEVLASLLIAILACFGFWYSSYYKVEAPTVTQLHYVFEGTGSIKEVTFFFTSSDNTNNAEIQNILSAGGRNAMSKTDSNIPDLGPATRLPPDIANDVWCRIRPSRSQSPILRVACFQPGHNNHGISVYGEYNPSIIGEGGRRTLGYINLDTYVTQLRQELRSLLVAKQAVKICIE